MEITLQNIPLPLEQALVIRASTEGKSVDRVALEVLQTSLGVVEEAKEPTIKRDLSFLWADGPLEPEVIQALEEQRQIDPELWK
jgi:plasmid stability protein